MLPQRLTAHEEDFLREIATVGSGHAATALAQLLGRTVWFAPPRARLLPFSAVAATLGGPEQLVVGVHQQLGGQLRGNVLLVLDPPCARRVLDALLGAEAAALDRPDELSASALCELANIVSGAYISALAALLGLRVLPSAPGLAIDMAGAVVDALLIDLGATSDAALVLDVDFEERRGPLAGRLFLLPAAETFATLADRVSHAG